MIEPNTNVNFPFRKLEWCHKCNASVPNLSHHTCAPRLVNVYPTPFTAEQEQRLREIIREELRK